MKRYHEQQKIAAYHVQAQSDLIVNNLLIGLFGAKNGAKVLTVYDYYPHIFDKEIKEKKEKELLLHKEQLSLYLQKRRGGGSI